MQNGKKSKLGSILLGIGAVCVVLRLVTKGPGWTLGAVVFLLVGAIVDGASRKRYHREVDSYDDPCYCCHSCGNRGSYNIFNTQFLLRYGQNASALNGTDECGRRLLRCVSRFLR